MVFQNPVPLGVVPGRGVDRLQDNGKYYCVGYFEEGLCALLMERGRGM